MLLSRYHPALLAVLVSVAWGIDFLRMEQQLVARFGSERISLFRDWQTASAGTSSVTEIDKLKRINDFINRRIQYGTDEDIWDLSDYWATPMETIGRGRGDCEDFAIIKFFSGIGAGIPGSKMRLVYVMATRIGPSGTYNQAHMVLAYYPTPEAEPLILDNLFAEIKPASRRPDLHPVFSFNSEALFTVTGKSSGVRGTTQLSRWHDLLQRARNEGVE